MDKVITRIEVAEQAVEQQFNAVADPELCAGLSYAAFILRQTRFLALHLGKAEADGELTPKLLEQAARHIITMASVLHTPAKPTLSVVK
jgi:hypothetical protein